VVNTQGVYCLKNDLATVQSSGAAIDVQAHNVTIDCNGFKLGGLGGGTASTAVGIDGSGTANLTVRGCNIRGFRFGVLTDATSGGGHLVEDNRFDGVREIAVQLYGDGSTIRRNQMLDTGAGSTLASAYVAGVRALGNIDVVDNQISVVLGDPDAAAYAIGIFHETGSGGQILGNSVSGVTASATGYSYGIVAFSSGVLIRDNSLSGEPANSLFAIGCTTTDPLTVAKDNVAFGFAALIESCGNAGGNTLWN